ncbi:MAG TPA: ROK family glucokinase [Mycobacteriales bacterium]|nr:ROK family glucokinase [Mycobacteriales bacterium]
MLTLGVDVGGTKVLAGVVDESGAVLARAGAATPKTDVGAIADGIARVVDELRVQHDVAALGIGAAGWMTRDGEVVRFAPHLAWRDEPLREVVAARTGLPVTVDNDGNTTAWAEHRFGAGRGVDDVIAVTVGTGIGCGLVLGGRVYRGASGVAAEPGHMRVVPDGRRCPCGNRGCWEQYASGSALETEAREIARSSPAAAGALLDLVAGDVDAIDGPVITRAAEVGDTAALDCFRIVGGWLGQGLADIAALLDPARFVIGGGVGEAGELLLAPARERFRAALTGRGHRPWAEIVPAALGTDAGLVGAADLARAALLLA